MHTRRNRRRPVAVAAALTVALAAAGAGTAAAGSGAPNANLITWSGDHLALGDSVAFGYRPMQITPTATYKNAANFAGYAENLQRAAGFKVVNASCPGETTRSFLTAGAPSNGCQNGPGTPFGYRTAFPLHTGYAGTQLAFAVDYLKTHRNTQLVSLTIGANDLFLCRQTSPDQCTGATFEQTVAGVGDRVSTILRTLRDEGNYAGPIVVLNYYALDYGDAAVAAQSQALGEALGRAARENGATIADSYATFKWASSRYGGDACAAGLLVRLTAGAARAFVARSESVLGAGRPSCPFCGNPIDPEGHLCVRANGFRRRQA